MDNVDKMFEPTLSGWALLIPQMMRSGRHTEDKEFMERFQRMKQVRDDLKKIEFGIERWIASTTKLSLAAKDLGKAVQTKKTTYQETAWNLDIEIKDTSALQNIKEKIAMIDTLIAQRSKLKYIKLKGDYAEYKLRQLRNKQNAESFQAQSERYLTVKKEAAKQREEIMKQVLVVVNKYVDQADENGVCDLVKPQLQAFKLSQFHVFLNCQKLIAGPDEDGDVKELEEHWNNFTQRIANDIPNYRAGGSFEASANVLADKLAPGGEGTAQNAAGYRDSDFDDEDLSEVDSKADKKEKRELEEEDEDKDKDDKSAGDAETDLDDLTDDDASAVN